MNYLRIAWRFWWIVLAGIAVASGVLILMLYHVKRTWPPLLVTKATHSYLAVSQLLVDSPTGPYLRTTDKQTAGPVVPRKKTSSPPTTVTTTPDQTVGTPTKPLVDAANLFPIFIESDEVAKIRVERFGVIPGAVSARALYAGQGTNRYRPSILPVMQITALSRTPKSATRLAETTARAFGIWLTRQQNLAHVPTAQRIVVRQLKVPRGAVTQGGSKTGLPMLLAFAIFAGFLGLAVVADRTFPRKPKPVWAKVSTDEMEELAHTSLTVASGSE